MHIIQGDEVAQRGYRVAQNRAGGNMLLVEVNKTEYVLVQHGRAVASWSASSMLGNTVKKLLERLDFRVEEVDASAMVASFGKLEDGDSPEWEVPALIQEVIEEFGIEALSRPLDRDEAMLLWEKARVLDGLLLEENVHLR